MLVRTHLNSFLLVGRRYRDRCCGCGWHHGRPEDHDYTSFCELAN